MNFKETNKFKIFVVENKYHLIEIKPDIEFEVNDVILLVQFQKELSGSIIPSLILPSPTSTTNSDVLKYMSKKTNLPYTLADAYVLNSVAQKILANLYIKVNSPERPTQFFNNKEDALNWLGQFFI